MKHSENGSVTMIVIVTVFFIVILLSSFFIYTSSRRRAQLEETQRIAEAYNGDMETLYEERAQKEGGASVFDTSFGRIDVVWLDTQNNVLEKPMAPVLSGMTAIKWNDGGIEETTSSSDTSWYEYVAGTGTNDNTNSRWANAKDSNGNYFVWIPRYAYRITYYADETSDIPTGYCDGRGIVDIAGNVIYDLDTGINTVTYNGMSYIVHPAFMDNRTNNFENGGWDSELAGIWVGKYETSGTSDDLKIIPNADPLNPTVGECYDYSFNYNRVRESHLMKNSEWGAVVYLAHSQYGRNGNEIDLNNSNTITGNSAGNTSAGKDENKYTYNTAEGIMASSTGNIYGIYDLSGGCYEYMASYNSSDTNNYKGLYGSSFTATNQSNKYSTRYINSSSISVGNVFYQAGKIGDATKEVYLGGTSTFNWFSDYGYMVDSRYPFFNRGGYYDDKNYGGIFDSNGDTGANSDNKSFRIVLAVQ